MESLASEPLDKTTIRRLEIIVAICSFFIGVSIYILWRDEHILIHRVLQTCGLKESTSVLRESVADISVPEWIRYSLPDGLWSLSYILFIDAMVKRDYLWTSVIPSLGIISEILQLANWLPGTFDVADLLAYFIPYLFYVLIIYRYK